MTCSSDGWLCRCACFTDTHKRRTQLHRYLSHTDTQVPSLYRIQKAQKCTEVSTTFPRNNCTSTKPNDVTHQFDRANVDGVRREGYSMILLLLSSLHRRFVSCKRCWKKIHTRSQDNSIINKRMTRSPIICRARHNRCAHSTASVYTCVCV